MTGPLAVLLDGAWRESRAARVLRAEDPWTGDVVAVFPVSPWEEVEVALEAGAAASAAIERLPAERLAGFLEGYADRLAAAADELVAAAARETGLPAAPRLRDVELPRTTGQLRQAAAVVRRRTWREPVLSPEARIASYLAPIPGVAVVLGPSNFPFAFNAAAGGDFAAAIASGHGVLAKANPGHPRTSALLAAEAAAALADAGLPPATVQLLYHLEDADGARLVADRRVAATAFTGSRAAGLALKAAADAAGRPLYAEMASINPAVVLPGAVRERGAEVAGELAVSVTGGAGQFCTKPGLVFAVGDSAASFAEALAHALSEREVGPLVSAAARDRVAAGVEHLVRSGASARRVGEAAGHAGHPTTLLSADGRAFLAASDELQREVFGNVVTVVSTRDVPELLACVAALEPGLAATVWSARDGADDDAYEAVAAVLRGRVGRLLDDKAPTGVAVVGAMHHGGPYPATGHPLFTAVGLPHALRRFAMVQCFDNVRDERLPAELRAANPLGLQRLVDGCWTDAPVVWGRPGALEEGA